MKRFFITGTDTDCGKTYVTCALQRYLLGMNATVHALKPIASGISEDDSDKARLQRNNTYPFETISKWQYKLPIAPHLAASLAKETIELGELINFCRTYPQKNVDYCFIEGAGGLYVPINDKHTWLDFIIHMNLPVIITVGLRLGCLNHALLTDQVLKNNAVPVLGWIANVMNPAMPMLAENVVTLLHRMNSPYLGTTGYMGAFEPADNFSLHCL